MANLKKKETNYFKLIGRTYDNMKDWRCIGKIHKNEYWARCLCGRKLKNTYCFLNTNPEDEVQCIYLGKTCYTGHRTQDEPIKNLKTLITKKYNPNWTSEELRIYYMKVYTNYLWNLYNDGKIQLDETYLDIEDLPIGEQIEAKYMGVWFKKHNNDVVIPFTQKQQYLLSRYEDYVKGKSIESITECLLD